MKTRTSDLKEERARIVKAMRAIHDKADDAGNLSPEDTKKFDEFKSELEGIEARIARAETMDEAERRMEGQPVNGRRAGHDGTFEDRARNDYSLARAILIATGDARYDGLERELGDEHRQRTGRNFEGLPVPDAVFETRTVTIGDAAASLYQTQHRPDLFIDTRRSAMVTATLGATTLTGLIGNQSIPRQIQSSTAQHVAEDSALTETDADFDDVDLAPKTVGALTSFSRRALINATPSVEQLIRNDLAAVIGRAVDFQALFGSGMSNTPVGVIEATNVADLTLVTPSWAEALNFVATIQSDDADLGTMGWVTHPLGVKTLRSTNKVASEPEHGFMMMDPGSLAGYRLVTTTAIPLLSGSDTYILFGAWRQLLIGFWSGIDLMANGFSDTAFPRGRVQVRAMQDYDVAVRHGQSFAFAEDLTASAS